MAAALRIDDRDRETYGGPEWVTIDRDALDDLAFDVLDALEREMGMSVAELLARELSRRSARGIKGIVWLARRVSGVDTVPFADFNIRTRLVRQRGAVPPSQGSSGPSSETDPSPEA